MKPPVIWDKRALQELKQAAAWYDKQRRGLGKEFLAEVEAAIARLTRDPFIFPQIHRTIRRALVRRFPYAVLFEYTLTMIAVISVFHSLRNPKRWQERL